MKPSRSHIFVIFFILATITWFWVNSGKKEEDTNFASQHASVKVRNKIPEVVISERVAELHDVILRLYGRTEPMREVTLKAETAGLVVSTPVMEGRPVKRGTIICKQDIDARQANLEQAQALLRTAEMKYSASRALVEKGYRSETQLATALAVLDGARASVKQAQIEIDNVNIRAPFYGVFERQIAEIGDFLSPGQPCGRLVELDPLIIVVELTENQVGNVEIGQTTEISLVTGEDLTGTVRMIEPRANLSTRTFRTEIEVPNPDFKLRGGITADVTLAVGQVNAHRIPSAILTLNDVGQVGVKFVDEQNRVGFVQTVTIDEGDEGIWVAGLPDHTRVIMQGQEFVLIGTEVNPVSMAQSGVVSR
ncbi:MAG: efflux RND transporter periplasmic adaptor subunit [Hyphomonadaceae bacterium]|nr:efflux RND transporter periplasmic adaptor subunit [Hyphomonadaceae bacterium]